MKSLAVRLLLLPFGQIKHEHEYPYLKMSDVNVCPHVVWTPAFILVCYRYTHMHRDVASHSNVRNTFYDSSKSYIPIPTIWRMNRLILEERDR